MTLEELRCDFEKVDSDKFYISTCIAKHFNSINKWRKGHLQSYLFMVNNECFPIIQMSCCRHMAYPDNTPITRLIKELCNEYNFKNVTSFRLKRRKEYDLIKQANFLDDLRSEINNRPYQIYYFDDCKEIALKYNNKTDWYKSNPSSYRKAERMNWLDECCKHMTSLGKGYNKQKHGILYILEITSLLGCKWYKIGITNKSVKERYYAKELKHTKVIKEVLFDNGYVPFQIELNIKRKLKGHEIPKNIFPLESGHSETFKTTKEEILDLYNQEKQKLKNFYTFSQLSLNL